jgi:hypothetical protein
VFAGQEGEDSNEFQDSARFALINAPLDQPRILRRWRSCAFWSLSSSLTGAKAVPHGRRGVGGPLTLIRN